MSKWRVWVQWDIEEEADDEGYALIQADQEFDFMSQARAEEIYEDEDE